MKKVPIYFLPALVLLVAVALYSCSQMENNPMSTNSSQSGTLLKPVKPTVTTTISGPIDDSLSIEVCVTPSSEVGGNGHLVINKLVGYLGSDSACGSPTQVQLDSFYVATPDDTCYTFRVLAPTDPGTYGFEGSFAPNRKRQAGRRDNLSGDGDCQNYVVPEP